MKTVEPTAQNKTIPKKKVLYVTMFSVYEEKNNMSNYLGFEPTANELGYFFISYNSEDAERVTDIISKVREKYKDEFEFWYDYGIEYNTKWDQTIYGKIDNCRKVLLFLTKGILEKGAHSWVYNEYRYSKQINKEICYVFLDDINNETIPKSLQTWWFDIESTQNILAYNCDTIVDEIAKSLGKKIIVSEKTSFYSFIGFADKNRFEQSEIIKNEFRKNITVLNRIFDDIENIINCDKFGEDFLDGCCNQLNDDEYISFSKNYNGLHTALKNRGSYKRIVEKIEKLSNDSEKFDEIIRVWFSETAGDRSEIRDFNFRFQSILKAEEPVKEHFIKKMKNLRGKIESTYEGTTCFFEIQCLLSVIFTEIYKSGLVFSKSKIPEDMINTFEYKRRQQKYNPNVAFAENLPYDEIIGCDVWRKNKIDVDCYCYNVIAKWLAGNCELLSYL